ncbi:MAG TPA: zf-HC2 domain-containing protein, partial [Candidatus Binataceae bacterium]|nr:zf-HC2 domain-containing protein [Candidatus Binataceae bacterium]
MDHRQYIEQYLSADVDGELSAPERQAVAAHLANCADCRQLQGDERALKALLQQRIPIVTAPPELRRRISAALDSETAPERAARRTGRARRPLWMGGV